MGLGAMLGAGVFAAFAPAARAAGAGILIALAVAGFVAYCNATSSAELAALYPQAGGTYVYGRERLGPFFGFLAGWGFVVGKIASCAAMAITFAAYAAPGAERPVAVAAVVVLTVVNTQGIQRTAALTRVIVAVALAGLTLAVVASLVGDHPHAGNLTPVTGSGGYGILQAAGLLFFAFAGYARIATLGEEVVEPERTIPKAIPLALGMVLVVYTAVAVTVLAVLGPGRLAGADAPLAAAVQAGSLDSLAPLVRVAAAIACLGVLLSLIAGIGRTAFAMAANSELPRALTRVHPRHRVPWVAEVAVGVVVTVLAATLDLRHAIGFSSFAVLVYYTIANASAFTLAREDRRWPRFLTVAGVAGCLAVAFSLPWTSVAAGTGVLAAGALVYAARLQSGQWRRPRSSARS
jgi:basic amino acid/polyamine antiporter, APA family